MLQAGVSQMLILFSFTSSAPALPTFSTSSSSQALARSVAHGHAVVFTPHFGRMRSPAGPSAVITFGTPYSGRFPIPNVLAQPVFGCPPRRLIQSSNVRISINSSSVILPSATSEKRTPLESRKSRKSIPFCPLVSGHGRPMAYLSCLGSPSSSTYSRCGSSS